MTAEAAMAMPVLLSVTVLLAWLLSLAVAQVRVVDAAREVARAVARDEPVAGARRLGERVAPEGAHIAVRSAGATVTVRVEAPVRGPGVLDLLPHVSVDAEAVAAREPG